MASVAMTRSSLVLPWAQADSTSSMATTSLSLRSYRPSSPNAASGFQPFNRPLSSLRSSSRPLAVIQEASPISDFRSLDSVHPLDDVGHAQDGIARGIRTNGLVTPGSHGMVASLTPPALDLKFARPTRFAIDTSTVQAADSQPSDDKPTSQISPLSRLSRLWSDDDSSTSLASRSAVKVFNEPTSLRTPFETYRSTSPKSGEDAKSSKRSARLKPKPLQLVDEPADSKKARRDSFPDILHGRRDSFTFHLPSDLRLDSPSPASSKNGSYGSSMLLHSPRPRRPSLVLASEHNSLTDEPYTPCWGLEPVPSFEQQQQQQVMQQQHQTPFAASQVDALPAFGPAYAPPISAAQHTQTVPPPLSHQYTPAQRARELETIFRPKTEVDTISAQPGHAALVTVTASSHASTSQSSGYPLSHVDVDRIAKLHNGRIPTLQQLAPPEHLCPTTSYDPIVNTGNQGPMVVQAGDWRCGVCSFVNWRRRRICLRCFPYANDIGKVLTIQSQRAAHLATPPAPTPVNAPPSLSFNATHTRVASAPVYPLDLDMYKSGVPSADLAALARSTSYPSTAGGMPYRPATTAAHSHYQVAHAYAAIDAPHLSPWGTQAKSAQRPFANQAQHASPYGPSTYHMQYAPPYVPNSSAQMQQPFQTPAHLPMTPPSTGTNHYPYESTLAYWGLSANHNSSNGGQYGANGGQSGISPTSSTPSATSAGEFAAKKRASAAKSFEAPARDNSKSQQRHAAKGKTAPKGFLFTTAEEESAMSASGLGLLDGGGSGGGFRSFA
ncbi:hypothetical protein JCM10908_007385 [Rhodotorula pacifica]|uniref:uncharacterized protein n=1 Tax=Rhodotorula pacifica TaxID=1495444 RepID=UPI0031707375